MSESNKIATSQVGTGDAPCTPAPATEDAAGNTVAARASTKDSGRVHIGGGMMHFHTTKDAGRVHIGGGMMRF
jgi:hypothetical protein